MRTFPLLADATDQDFEEAAYLRANPDVARLVREGGCPSGVVHFELFGRAERRKLRREIPYEWKHRKLDRVRPLLLPGLPHREILAHIDCLTDALRTQYAIVPTDNVSEHDYDHEALRIIEANPGGLVLDCGAGQRSVYYDNVVNYEIVPYDTTDVLGVAEQLPFRDHSFDAVICLNVLEHVKDPFQVSRELMRVLKPGGELMAVAPFLQPLHGYPHHYYNMTAQGLQNLFEPLVEKTINVYGAMRPIWSVNWILQRYAAGLEPKLRTRFEQMTVAELMQDAKTLEADPIAMRLSESANSELASAHALNGRAPRKELRGRDDGP